MITNFGERLRELRKERGIPIYEMAAKLGISRNTLTNWERGKKEPHSIEVLEGIAKILEVPLSKSFPAPNYKKLLETGMTSWKVDAVRALRDTIPLKPKKYSWRVREWAKEMTVLRDMAVSVFEDKWMEEEFSSELEKFRKQESEYSRSL